MSATPGQTTSYEGKSIMPAKKKTSLIPDAGLQTLKIGSRVRCTDDRVEGRIVWANGVSVKITWDDGEQVTWRRDSLADRPIEILGGDEDQPAPAAAPEPTEPTEPAAPEPPPAAPELAQEPPAAATLPSEPTMAETPPAAPAPEPMSPAPAPAEAGTAAASEPAQTAAKPKRQRKAAAEPQDKKLSALDAAAKVLAETRTPMSCQELIGAMAVKGYWTSPGGKTPAATLYSAMSREIATKGDQARFTKTGRGHFAYQGA
jgi:HB1, ASXL, restriction endonuclease HTH domain